MGKLGKKLKKDDFVRRLSTTGLFGAKDPPSPDLERGPPKSDSPATDNIEMVNPETQVRNRKEMPRYEPHDWDDSLPYGGKVYLPRKRKPDSFLCFSIQVLGLVFAFVLMYCAYFHMNLLHFHVTKLYARMGHKEAQAYIGHKLLHGKGIDKDHDQAMVWLHEAAKQGHPHAAYNVAVGHLQGIKTSLQPGEAKTMIEHAAKNGIPEAAEVLDKVCSKGKCDS